MRARSLQSCLTLCDPVVLLAPLHMAPGTCTRQEYWSGLPCPPPGNLPDPGIKSTSLISPALVGNPRVDLL